MKRSARSLVALLLFVAIAAPARESFAQVVAASSPPPRFARSSPAPLNCTARVIGGHNYFFCPVALAHDQAHAFCASFGTELASVAHRYENEALAEVVRSLGRGRHLIGHTDREVEGRFEPDDGSPGTFTNWASGEPNNVGDEDCVELDGSSLWNDIPCTHSPGNVVCEESSPCTAEVFDQHVYNFCRGRRDARAWCHSIGSEPVSIDNDAERRFVFEMSASNGVGACSGLTAQPAVDGVVCESATPCERRFYNGTTYLFCLNAGTTARAARAQCRAMGGALATIDDEAENDFAYSSMIFFRRNRFYIGLSDELTEGSFVGPDARPAGFTRWAPGEPNDQENEDCVELFDTGWNDMPCDRVPLGAFVCEMPHC